MRERMVLSFSLQLEDCFSIFIKTRLSIVVSHFVAKQQFSAIQKLTLSSLLKIMEGLKTATEMALLFLMASFFQNSLIYCCFCLKLRAARLLRMHFVAKQQFSAIQKLKLFSLLKIKERISFCA